MKASLTKHLKSQTFLTIVALLVGGAIVYAASDLGYFLSSIVGNGFQVPVGITARVDTDKIVGSAASDCRIVTNNGGGSIFVPTNSLAEWNAFVSNPPSGVTLASCAPTCTYAWSSPYTVCADHNNNPPYTNLDSGTCDSSTVNKYKTLSNTYDPNCNLDTPLLGDHTHYVYEICNASCVSGPTSVNGVCGSAATGYSSSATFPYGAYCAAGTANPSSPANPTTGTPSTWTCQGANGGSDLACMATRAAPALPTYSWVATGPTCTPPSGSQGSSCDSSHVGWVQSGSLTPTSDASCTITHTHFTYNLCTQF